ncbi:MAG: transposase [Burkholderiales bacterium]|nr:transposase [Burkholderiales bacterium]
MGLGKGPEGGRELQGKVPRALSKAEADGTLARDPAADPAQRGERQRALARHDWVVYAKAALAGPAAVLDYLSRYTNRTAIGAERLLAIRGDEVLLRVRGDDAGAEGGEGGKHGAKGGGKARRKRVVAVDGVDFVGRFLQHVLPSGSSASATTGCWPRRPRPSGW